ncbi:MAG: hypothetical protein R3F30_03235 [Planctomycetota bacterium]
MQLVTAKRIKEHAFKLAGGEFRLTGTPGQKRRRRAVERARPARGWSPGATSSRAASARSCKCPVTLFGIDDESGLPGKERICQHGGWFNLTGPLTRRRGHLRGQAGLRRTLRREAWTSPTSPTPRGCIAVFTMEWPQPDRRRSGQLPGIYQAMQGMIRFAPSSSRAEWMARDNNAVGTIVLIEDYDPVFLAITWPASAAAARWSRGATPQRRAA